MRLYYAAFNQPVIEPPSYVEKMDANMAVAAHKPQAVVGAFVTQKFQEGDTEAKIGSSMYGPNELQIVDKCPFRG